MSRYSISRIARRVIATGSLDHKKGAGRPPALSDRSKRLVVNHTNKHRRHSRKEVRHILNLKCSNTTLTRLYKKEELLAHRPVRKPLLRATSIAKRLAWANAHLHWSTKRWLSVIFSDECHFDLYNPQRRHIRRPPVALCLFSVAPPLCCSSQKALQFHQSTCKEHCPMVVVAASVFGVPFQDSGDISQRMRDA